MPFERKYKNSIFLIALCVIAIGFITGCLYIGFFCGGGLSQICAEYKTSFENSVKIFPIIADRFFAVRLLVLQSFSVSESDVFGDNGKCVLLS